MNSSSVILKKEIPGPEFFKGFETAQSDHHYLRKTVLENEKEKDH